MTIYSATVRQTEVSGAETNTQRLDQRSSPKQHVDPGTSVAVED